MRNWRLVPVTLVVLAAVVAPAGAAARVDKTATETCLDSGGNVVVTTVVDVHGLGGLSGADTHFNATPLGLTCTTVPTP